MNTEIYKITADSCSKAYDIHKDLGATQFDFSLKYINGELVQILSIPGTNELEDMISNLNLSSWKGIKYGAYRAAKQIRKHIELDPALKLYITGHSLGGATAIAFKRLFSGTHCIAFAPARCLRYWVNRRMKDTTVFIDPDDVVPKLGFISFGLPICEFIKAKSDHTLISITDHKMKHWVEFVNKL